MTPSHLLIVAVALVAIWSMFEGAERDLFALLDDPAPTWVPVRCAWISARVAAALLLVVVCMWGVLSVWGAA